MKNSRLIHFLIIKTVAKFVIQETNYNAYLDPKICPSRFKPWVRFVNEQCLASTALTASAELQIQPLYDFYSTTLNATLLDEYRLIGDIRVGDVNGRRSILIILMMLIVFWDFLGRTLLQFPKNRSRYNSSMLFSTKEI